MSHGWHAREENLDFLLCVMVSLECFKQGSDPNWIQLAFEDDPFGCCWVVDVRGQEKNQSPGRRPWKMRWLDQESEDCKRWLNSRVEMCFGGKKSQPCWLARARIGAQMWRDGTQGWDRKSLRP